MIITYHQMTRILRDESGNVVGAGYSGHGDGRNNPAAAAMHAIGPLPIGDYILGAPKTHPRLGPFAMPLTPATGTELYGRSDFWVHGDNTAHPGQSSDGCIVLDLVYREILENIRAAAGQVIIRVINTSSPYTLLASGCV